MGSDNGSVPLIAEFEHVSRPVQMRNTVPTDCPAFLMNLPPRVGALPCTYDCSSRSAEYYKADHSRVWVGPEPSQCAGNLIMGKNSQRSQDFSPEHEVGLRQSRPAYGWSNIVIPDKHSLISDAGKLFVLDGLLSRLKEEG